MSRRKPQFRGAKDPEELLGAAQQALDYVRPYLKWLLLTGAALAVVLLIWGGYSYFQHSREVQAQAALQKVRPELSRPDQAEAAIQSLTTLIQQYPSKGVWVTINGRQILIGNITSVAGEGT